MKIVYTLILLFVLNSAYHVLQKNLGNGYKLEDLGYDYWQSIVNTDGEVVPVKVVEYDSDDKYIISVRIIIELYECYAKDTTNYTSKNNIALPFLTKKKLQYWLIDKSGSIAYISKNKIRIEEKLELFNSSLRFNDKDYKDNRYMNTKGIENKLNPKHTCILSNDPFKDTALVNIINLDTIKQTISAK